MQEVKPIKKQSVIGQTILAVRTQRGWTQKELAERVGYSKPNFIGMLERQTAEFPIDRWLDFANALEYPPAEFLKLVIKEKFPDMLPYLRFKNPTQQRESLSDARNSQGKQSN